MRLLSISSALRCATSDTLRPAPYLLRYTHRVAISNSRLLRFDQTGVTFRHKDYRRAGADRQQVMTLAADQFIRRFLLHFLPKGFHRIRHYGLLAGVTRKAHLNQVRQMLGAAPSADADALIDPPDVRSPAHAAAGTWSLSKPSNDGADHEPRRVVSPRPGPPRHDPAWPGITTRRSSCAAGDDAAHSNDAAQRTNYDLRPLALPESRPDAAAEGNVPAHHYAVAPPLHAPHTGAKSENP